MGSCINARLLFVNRAIHRRHDTIAPSALANNSNLMYPYLHVTNIMLTIHYRASAPLLPAHVLSWEFKFPTLVDFITLIILFHIVYKIALQLPVYANLLRNRTHFKRKRTRYSFALALLSGIITVTIFPSLYSHSPPPHLPMRCGNLIFLSLYVGCEAKERDREKREKTKPQRATHPSFAILRGLISIRDNKKDGRKESTKKDPS